MSESTASTPEQVDTVDVLFGRPDAGWLDFSMATASQKISWRLSYVFDPFHDDFTIWLESIVDHGQGNLSVDIEGNFAEIYVTAAGADRVNVIGKSVYEIQRDFEIEIPRRRFVSDFYSRLVAFWEGDELKQYWDEWSYALKRPDWREDYPPEVQEKLEKPWPIRSQKIERFLGRARRLT